MELLAMRNKTFILLAVVVAVLLAGAVAVYAYDSSTKDEIAEGVSVEGVDVGGLSKEDARAKIEKEVAEPLQQPVIVRYRGKRFTLGRDESKVRLNVDATVDSAVAESRDGNIVSRSFRNITGGKVDKDIPVDVSYSRPAVTELIKRVKADVDEPAQDADLKFSSGGFEKVQGHDGRTVLEGQLRRSVIRALQRPGDRAVTARTDTTKPKVTTAQLAKKYPAVLRLTRASFQLSLYRNLKLEKTYSVAVGQQGLETPAGLYHIQNKGENVPWNVPKSAWAGDLAGTTIPGGAPNNPLKARWLGIFDGAGIHGTDNIASLGSAASHGCVRMSIPDVIELYPQVPVGAPIYIG